MDAAIDHGHFLGCFWSELTLSSYRAAGSDHCPTQVAPVTDCRSIYDAVRRLSTSLAEKRVQIDLAAIREACGGGVEGSAAIRLVPTPAQRADGLPKRCLRYPSDVAEHLNLLTVPSVH